MSPRGVAITDVRRRLFDAAERVLAREGPAGVTNRAVTEEAGCAKGVLHAHFADLDTFLAELVLDRLRTVAERSAGLADGAGEGTVTGNLTQVALSLLGSHGPAIAALALSRPTVTERVRTAWRTGTPGMASVEAAVAAYLDAEKALGRVAAETDTAMLALAVVGTVHHLRMTSWPGGPDPAAIVPRLVAALTHGTADGRPAP